MRGSRIWARGLAVVAAVGVLAGGAVAVAGQYAEEPELRNATVRPGPGGELPDGVPRPAPDGDPDGGPDTRAADVTAARGKGGAITRADVITRARSWVAAKVPYCLGHRLKDCADKYYRNGYGNYRADCSGFVSMSWNLDSSLTTRSLPGVARRIGKSDLKAGDILNRSGRHVVLFHKWANSSKTAYRGYEQTPPRAVYRKIPYPYFDGGDGYAPYRYRNIVDGPTTVPNDKSVNGDSYADLVAVDGKVMWLYPAKASGRYGKRVRIGGGWRDNYHRIALGDANADGHADIFATATDGTLFYWQNRGDGRYAKRRQVGHGWKTKRWFAVADANGDGRADLFGVHGDKLLLYVGKGDGTFGRPALVDRGWARFNRVVAGDADRDGRADLFATDRAGRLWYAKNSDDGWGGHGVSFPSVRRVGAGWDVHRQVVAADVTGDRRTDLVAVRRDGTLWLYPGAGNGGFGKARRVGHGWSGLRLATY